ncbi:MAG: hypothetical protein RIM72_17830 [Alphaproteobacteria bacterium]
MIYSTLDETEIWVEKPEDRRYLAENGLPKPHQKEGFEFWKLYCDGESLPHASKIDPLLMPVSVLPWVDLIEVKLSPRRFRIRLWGTGNVSAIGKDYSGTQMEEAGMDEGVRRLNVVFEKRMPYFAILPVDWHSDDYRHSTHYSVLGLPFQDEHGDITRILCILGFG